MVRLARSRHALALAPVGSFLKGSSTQVAYERFASVYKDFQEIGAFQREFGVVATRRTGESHACSSP
jgi:transcriptional regulator NrdR family protein